MFDNENLNKFDKFQIEILHPSRYQFTYGVIVRAESEPGTTKRGNLSSHHILGFLPKIFLV